MDDDECLEDTNSVKTSQSKGHNKKLAGAFASFGLDNQLLKGILRKGYRQPTPIQRKTIPVILSGKDVVAMARTGSGKTAAFLIPLFQRLKTRSAKSGARALLISPTRELALQTFQFTKELGKFVGLRAAVVIGGDSLDEQFSAIHENPDIIIATPGRLLHLVMEMNLKLTSVEYVVFDEADRLFEMGFEEQLLEVMKRLSDSRQTLLFSATLPKCLVDFAHAGLSNPVLVRLDVDTRVSDQLEMIFMYCRFEDKLAVLLHLLSHVIPQEEQAIIFCATKHHVEYVRQVLEMTGYAVSYLYSALDSDARKLNIGSFRQRKTRFLVVTDIAARGVDVPLLDNAINFHFSTKPKLFVHRVGRVARAGRAGRAYSLIASDELPYLFDLFLFLGRSLQFAEKNVGGDTGRVVQVADLTKVGGVPQQVIDAENESLRRVHETSEDLTSMKKVISNAWKQYLRSRPAASKESITRAKKELRLDSMGLHALFKNAVAADVALEEEHHADFLKRLSGYKPHLTILELNRNSKDSSWQAMKDKRRKHQRLVKSSDNNAALVECNADIDDGRNRLDLAQASEADLSAAFETVNKKTRKQAKVKQFADKEHFVPYQSMDHYTEHGLAVDKVVAPGSFEASASDAVLDLMQDEGGVGGQQKRHTARMHWDRKRKKFVGDAEDSRKKKIRTESGVLVPASYKSNLYEKWKQKQRYTGVNGDEGDFDDASNTVRSETSRGNRRMGGRRGRHNALNFARTKEVSGVKKQQRPQHGELKKREQIMKQRKKTDRLKSYQNHRREQHSHKRKGQKGRRK